MPRLGQAFFFGLALTAVCLGAIDLPFGWTVVKQVAALVLAPGAFVMGAITRGMLVNASYYEAAAIDTAFYTALALLVPMAWRRLRRRS